MLAMTISDTLETRLRNAAKLQGKTPELMAAEALEYWLEAGEWAACRASSHEPNIDTIEAIRGSRRDTTAKAYPFPRDLFAELDGKC